jgi:CubicO group peptidase (beta-lactamase class C family)
MVSSVSCCFSTIMLNSVIAQPTASQFTTAKESSIMLLNNVKRYLPDASIVVCIITSNGTQVYGYGNISKANTTKVNGNTIFDTASITKTFTTTLLADMVKQGLVNLDGTYITYPYILIHLIYGFAIADPLKSRPQLLQNLGL